MSMSVRKGAVLAGLAIAVTAALGVAPSAVAAPRGADHAGGKPRTVHVKGLQPFISAGVGYVEYEMQGSLVGRWITIRVGDPLFTSQTLYSEAGVEVFRGCLDRNRDKKCGSKDLNGEFHATYLAWASNDLNGRLVKGECVHAITGGNGAFTGARGVIRMFDRPVGVAGVETTYRGTVELGAVSEPATPSADLPEPANARASASMATASATPRGC